MGVHLPKFATVKTWMAMSGMSERTTYDYMGLGDLKAVKLGRKTLIDVEAGLAWLKSRPLAKIKPPLPNTRRNDRAGAEA